MVVGNLYVFRSAFSPLKADPPLIIDPDAVLTFSVTRQRLESVSWDCRDVLEFFSVIEHPEFPARHLLDVGELTTSAATEKLLRFPAAEGADHHASISRKSLNEDRYERAEAVLRRLAAAGHCRTRQAAEHAMNWRRGPARNSGSQRAVRAFQARGSIDSQRERPPGDPARRAFQKNIRKKSDLLQDFTVRRPLTWLVGSGSVG